MYDMLQIACHSLHAYFLFLIFQVSLHGGQVLSWKTDRGEELLFISSKVNDIDTNSSLNGWILSLARSVFV